jgi:hypothetical protein
MDWRLHGYDESAEPHPGSVPIDAHLSGEACLSHWMVLHRVAASSTLRWAVTSRRKSRKTPDRQAIGQKPGGVTGCPPLISGRTEAKIVDQPSDAAFNVVADGTDG